MSRSARSVTRPHRPRLALKTIILGLSLASPAWGHGDAAWIMEDGKTSYCCGPSDCERAPLSAIRATRGGWLVIATGQVFNEGDPDLHMSKDQDFWWCRPPSMGGKVKCLFAPAGGV